jgi:hypothetical protein
LNFAGKKKRVDLPWFLHSRHRYDPPEVVTVATVTTAGGDVHWGYHRDDPDIPPTQVVASVVDTKRKRGRFRVLSPTLLQAMLKHGKEVVRRLKGGTKSTAIEILAQVTAAAKEATVPAHPKRDPIDSTLSTLGIVVPYDESTQVGWRELSVADDTLATYLESLLEAKEKGGQPDFTELDRLITFGNIANDECDPGQALKLGLDLFTMVELDSDTANLLSPTYTLLGRTKFAEVIEKHTAESRRRSDEHSALQV